MKRLIDWAGLSILYGFISSLAFGSFFGGIDSYHFFFKFGLLVGVLSYLFIYAFLKNWNEGENKSVFITRDLFIFLHKSFKD